MSGHQPRCIWELGATLGEGPVWQAAENALYFVDIKGRQVHRCDADGGNRRSWSLPEETGFALPIRAADADGADGATALICGLPGRLVKLAIGGPDDGAVTPMYELEADLPGNRLNDGYVDRHGCLWFGSMDNAETAPSGALYRLCAGRIERKDSGYVITNGPCTSPDGRTFYHTDTLEKVVYAFDIDDHGALSGKREFCRIASSGYPDGSTVDADGNVWIALFGGARVERYAPDGKLLDAVALPCSNVTKIAFGGPDLRTAFVTTARKGLSADELAAQPLAGGVFSFRVAAPGQVQHQYLTGPAT